MQNLLIFIVSFVLISCGQDSARQTHLLAKNSKQRITSKNGILTLSEESLPTHEVWKNKQQKLGFLEETSVRGEYNASFYHEGKSVYVRPNLFFHGGFDLEQRVDRVRFGQGYEEIEIPLVVIDPLQKEVLNKEEDNKIKVPSIPKHIGKIRNRCCDPPLKRF